MECPYCKAENRDNVRFCSNCGRQLNASPIAATGSSAGSTGSTGNTTIGGNSRSLTPGSRVQGGRYVIKKILGQGGMGAALLATDIRLDSKPVVIKELISDNTDPAKLQEDVRNFKREVATLAHIDHPLVPNVTDHFQEGTRYFMVQEYVEGENLEDRMDRVNQPMKEREALGYASEVLDILDYLAQQTPPIVHRDIKPANIIIGAKDKRAHLVDFGIARADVAKNAQKKQTSALGTPGYAPPEQYQGNADPRSDLYALAATMHHILTNRDPRNHPPFTYPPVRQINPTLSPEIERVLTKALTNDINQRYQSASAMKGDIDDILLNRFGVTGATNSYVLGSSGPMGAVKGSTSTSANAPTMINPPPQQRQQGQQQYPQRTIPPSYNPQTPYFGVGGGGLQSPPPRQQQSHWVRNSILALIVVALIVGLIVAIPYIRSRTSTTGNTGNGAGTPGTTLTLTPVPYAPNGIGVTSAANGETIGISDGTFAFDTTNRADSTVKKQASASLKAGDPTAAQSFWASALAQDSNDAEVLIYQEDQTVLSAHASGTPYITIVIASMLTGGDFQVGRDDLQGAYVAQKEFNDGAKLTGGTQVRLLIANSGSQGSDVNRIASQIVQLAKSDPTFVGVMGWPFSSRTLNATDILRAARIPMLSQTASTDLLTNRSPYFFRVAPSNNEQGIIGAKYAANTLHAKSVALFVDPGDAYSESLANDFANQFRRDGNQVVVTENYTVGQSGRATLPAKLQDALTHNPDAIYFSGYAADISTILTNLPTSGQFANIPLLGGDALYELGGYPSSARNGFTHLHFTAFAYPDTWGYLGLHNPAFFSEYTAAYDQNGQHSGYGYNRADNDVILSYDAIITMLNATNIALASHKNPTPVDLQQALLKINGVNTVQGVSGQIALGPDGNPINKSIVVLKVSPTGTIQLESVQGKFLK